MTNKHFPKIQLFNNDGRVVEGELVLESTHAFQVAVKGKILIFNKTEWGFTRDVFSEFFGGVSDNDPFSQKFGRY